MRRLTSIVTLTCCYLIALAVSRAGRWIVPTRQGRIRTLALIGRFDNPGWFRAHTTPLCRAGLDEVVVVADGSIASSSPILFDCPPAWLRPIGRAAGKLVWLLVVAARRRPDCFMGFHLFPGALTALMTARLFGRPACYQMTGGEVEIVDGGARDENGVLAGLGGRSPLVERLALAVAAEFDLVIVRGSKAQRFLQTHGVTAGVTVNTGSVTGPAAAPRERHCEIVFVGRLTPIKQPRQFVEIVRRVADRLPGVRAAIIGDGPLISEVERLRTDLHLEGAITLLGQRADADDLVAAAKVFVLTSKSEGLSIALAEAMAAGVVPVVADVGELSDLVTDGVTGFIVPPNDVERFAERILSVLSDEPLRARLSDAARDAALRHTSIETVAARWRRDFARIGGHAEFAKEGRPACAE